MSIDVGARSHGSDAGTRDPLIIDVAAAEYVPHAAHTTERDWPETNCYLDLWIEILHALGQDPVPAFGCALSATHDGAQWTFVKPQPEDLRRLYGLEVTEENLWRPVLDTVETAADRGLLFTVEVDSWWLPDTAATDYRSAHVKTTIVPTLVDRAAQTMTYIHNAGIHELSGEDFVGAFNLQSPSEWVLPPYVEQIRRVDADAAADVAVRIARTHLDRRPASNPVAALGDSVRTATGWLGSEGLAVFHRWAFATLRQCGASAEVAADLAHYLDTAGAPGAAAAADPFRTVSASAKAVQFKLARAARGRTVDVEGTLATMTTAWAAAMDILDQSVPGHR